MGCEREREWVLRGRVGCDKKREWDVRRREWGLRESGVLESGV